MFIVNFEHISHFVLVFFLLTLIAGWENLREFSAFVFLWPRMNITVTARLLLYLSFINSVNSLSPGS